MSDVWEISHHFPMYILFDVVNPVRLFKRGTEFDERDPDLFPNYNFLDDANVMDSDDMLSLQPYKWNGYRCVHLTITIIYLH